jgi:hypothetical protein
VPKGKEIIEIIGIIGRQYIFPMVCFKNIHCERNNSQKVESKSFNFPEKLQFSGLPKNCPNFLAKRRPYGTKLKLHCNNLNFKIRKCFLI